MKELNGLDIKCCILEIENAIQIDLPGHWLLRRKLPTLKSRSPTRFGSSRPKSHVTVTNSVRTSSLCSDTDDQPTPQFLVADYISVRRLGFGTRASRQMAECRGNAAILGLSVYDTQHDAHVYILPPVHL